MLGANLWEVSLHIGRVWDSGSWVRAPHVGRQLMTCVYGRFRSKWFRYDMSELRWGWCHSIQRRGTALWVVSLYTTTYIWVGIQPDLVWSCSDQEISLQFYFYGLTAHPTFRLIMYYNTQDGEESAAIRWYEVAKSLKVKWSNPWTSVGLSGYRKRHLVK